VLALIVAVVVLDQAAKWWAWRHFSWTRINSGGDVLVGRTIGAWYAGPVTGAVLDLLDFGLLSIVVSVLVRRRATAAVGVPGALMTGGWGSNLLDRLGIHYWTAPGSVRGVVDFIHIGGHYYNVADLFIVGCTPLFLLAAGYHAVRAARRPVAAGSVPRPARSRVRARTRILALAGAGLILVVALGAANYGGVNAALRAPTSKTANTHARSRPHPASGSWLPLTRQRVSVGTWYGCARSWSLRARHRPGKEPAKSRASGQHSLSVPPGGTASQRCSRSRTPRMAMAIFWSSTRASRSRSDGSFCRAARSRTPAGVSGPSPQRLATQFVIVLARRCPAVSHIVAGTPAAAPETIRPCFCRSGSRAAAA